MTHKTKPQKMTNYNRVMNIIGIPGTFKNFKFKKESI